MLAMSIFRKSFVNFKLMIDLHTTKFMLKPVVEFPKLGIYYHAKLYPIYDAFKAL